MNAVGEVTTTATRLQLIHNLFLISSLFTHLKFENYFKRCVLFPPPRTSQTAGLISCVLDLLPFHRPGAFLQRIYRNFSEIEFYLSMFRK